MKYIYKVEPCTAPENIGYYMVMRYRKGLFFTKFFSREVIIVGTLEKCNYYHSIYEALE